MNEAASLPRFQIDDVKLQSGLVLSPMSGVTDSPFRRLVKHCSGDHVGLMLSEFISIERLTAGEMRQQIQLMHHPEERPVGIQLYGADPLLMAEAAEIVEDSGASLVDINAGCPKPKVVRRGGGAGLLRELDRLGEIVAAVKARVSIPVTVKIRNGWDEDSINYMDTLEVVESAGASALAIHGRTRLQLYRGLADWDPVKDLKAKAKIPILGSGDVLDVKDARMRFQETGCDGILIGRGAIMNPWIFKHIGEAYEGKAVAWPSWAELVEALRLYLGWLGESYPPKVAPARMKMMLSRFLKGVEEDPELRIRCLKLSCPEDMLRHVEEVAKALGIWDSQRELSKDVA